MSISKTNMRISNILFVIFAIVMTCPTWVAFIDIGLWFFNSSFRMIEWTEGRIALSSFWTFLLVMLIPTFG